MSNQPQTLEEQKLLRWVNDVIARESKSKTYGSIVINLEAGKITRINTTRSERPVMS